MIKYFHISILIIWIFIISFYFYYIRSYSLFFYEKQNKTFYQLSLENPELFINFNTNYYSYNNYNILIICSLHGNELGSIYAINELLYENWFSNQRFINKTINIQIIIGNIQAVKEKKRFIKYNMNRLFNEDIIKDKRLNINIDSYELYRVEEIIKYLHWAHYILDLHSCSSFCPPHGIPCSNIQSEYFASLLPTSFTLINTSSLVKGSIGEWGEKHNKTLISVECGQHDNIETISNAKEIIKTYILSIVYNTEYYIIDTKNNPIPLQIVRSEFVMEGFSFIREFKAFEYLPYGTEIAKDLYKTMIITEKQGGYIIMPTALPFIGEEAFFIGISI